MERGEEREREREREREKEGGFSSCKDSGMLLVAKKEIGQNKNTN